LVKEEEISRHLNDDERENYNAEKAKLKYNL